MRLIVGLVTLLSVLCFATGVSAHASLVAMEPADGSVVAQAPKTVQLRFNEPVAPAVIRLIMPRAERAAMRACAPMVTPS